MGYIQAEPLDRPVVAAICRNVTHPRHIVKTSFDRPWTQHQPSLNPSGKGGVLGRGALSGIRPSASGTISSVFNTPRIRDSSRTNQLVVLKAAYASRRRKGSWEVSRCERLCQHVGRLYCERNNSSDGWHVPHRASGFSASLERSVSL